MTSTALIDGIPRLIQAGMGIHVSSARLARATSRLGALGVVSGAALRHIVIEDIRSGDEEAIEFARRFPIAHYVEEILQFAPGGKKHGQAVPVDTPDPRHSAYPRRLSAIAAYVEVLRAKYGHRGKVGINVMWKAALTALPTIYGAMLAGVDALLCGAGVPMELPDIVAKIRTGQDMEYLPLTGTGTHARLAIAQDETASLLQRMPAPKLIPILSNFAFSKRILDVWHKEYSGARPFAFVLENHAAGGHNAPPRNKSEFTAQDDIESYFDKVRALGVPVYVAGAFEHGGTRADFEEWMARGAYGLQVGSRFALCEESGMRRDLRAGIVEKSAAGALKIETDPQASPTGYPLKTVQLEGTVSEPQVYAARRRVCNKMYLTRSHFVTQPDGSVKENYICPAMPPEQYARLGGDVAETEGKVCLCNGLLSTAGYYDDIEPPVLTLGASGKHVTQHSTARAIVEELLTPEYVARKEKELALAAEE
jgi:NAD(P)H-dependent flavin oxidoreductase YrpB (nitropropane dioxygenase family)